jgi:hypothetical protein
MVDESACVSTHAGSKKVSPVSRDPALATWRVLRGRTRNPRARAIERSQVRGAGLGRWDDADRALGTDGRRPRRFGEIDTDRCRMAGGERSTPEGEDVPTAKSVSCAVEQLADARVPRRRRVLPKRGGEYAAAAKW